MILLWIFKICSVIRSVTGYIIDLFTRYPLQFILVLVCCYALWQKMRYDAIVSDYANYKSSIAYQAELQKQKNEMLRKEVVAHITEIVAIHTKQLADEGLDRKRVEAKLKGSINEISNELNIYRDAVIVRNSATSSIDVSKVAEHTSGTPDTKSNCNETLATVVDACIITDIDYEALYNLYNKQCKIRGCN
jgi:hypothetical protein